MKRCNECGATKPLADLYRDRAARDGHRPECSSCTAPRSGGTSFHIHHDHTTGEVRALLCFRCNGGLGQFRENPSLLQRASGYLEVPRDDWIERHRVARMAEDRARELAEACG